MIAIMLIISDDGDDSAECNNISLRRCSKKVLMIAPVVCMIVWALGIVFLATFPQLPIYLIFIAIAIGNISGGYVTLKVFF